MINDRTWVQVQNVFLDYIVLQLTASKWVGGISFQIYWTVAVTCQSDATVSEISKHSTWRNKQDHVTLPQPQVPLQLPAKCCGEWGRDRASLTLTAADMKSPVAGSAQAFQGSTGAAQEHSILWRGSGKADVAVFTTFTTPSGEALPFSRLQFVRNITPKIPRHERDHLLEKG